MNATKKKSLKKEKDEVVSSNPALKNFGLRKRTEGVVEKKSETKKNKVVDPIPEPIPPTEFEVEQIVGKQIVSDVVFYQVKWKGFSLEETTWEPQDNLENAPMKIKDYENSLLEKKKSEKKTSNKKDIIKGVSEPQKLLGKRSKAKEEEEEIEEDKEEDDEVKKHNDVLKKVKTEETDQIPEKKKKGRPRKVVPAEKDPGSTPTHGEITKITKHHDLGFIEKEEETKKKEVDVVANEKKNKDQNHVLEEKQKPNEKEKETSIGNKLQPEISDESRAQTPNSHTNDSGNIKTPQKLHLKIHRNVNEYGSFAKGDTPVKVIGVRHTKEKPDLEVMVAWKLRDDGSQPINSKVSRLELLQKGFWLPLIEFYESKMKMENSPDFNPDSLPKMCWALR